MFQIGDRVVCVVNNPNRGPELRTGMTGVIVSDTDIPHGYAYGVQMDDPIFNGHNLNGYISTRNGYWIEGSWFTLLYPEDEFEINLEDIESVL